MVADVTFFKETFYFTSSLQGFDTIQQVFPVTSFCTLSIGDNIITWKNMKQNIIAWFSAEAMCKAMANSFVNLYGLCNCFKSSDIFQ